MWCKCFSALVYSKVIGDKECLLCKVAADTQINDLVVHAKMVALIEAQGLVENLQKLCTL